MGKFLTSTGDLEHGSPLVSCNWSEKVLDSFCAKGKNDPGEARELTA